MAKFSTTLWEAHAGNFGGGERVHQALNVHCLTKGRQRHPKTRVNNVTYVYLFVLPNSISSGSIVSHGCNSVYHQLSLTRTPEVENMLKHIFDTVPLNLWMDVVRTQSGLILQSRRRRQSLSHVPPFPE